MVVGRHYSPSAAGCAREMGAIYDLIYTQLTSHFLVAISFTVVGKNGRIDKKTLFLAKRHLRYKWLYVLLYFASPM